MSPMVKWGILWVVGVLIAVLGGVVMLLGGYVGYGESMSKPAQGIPIIGAGALGALAGISIVVIAVVRMVRASSARHSVEGPATATPR